jgi:hypothetical protein
MTAECIVQDTPLNCALRARGSGGIPVEYKGATVPPPDTRRSYS